MRANSYVRKHQPSNRVVFTSLPGPSRKREPRPYCYRLTYRNPQPQRPGCVLLWDVYGGRDEYQIVLERDSAGKMRWHCTCADAVYRGENAPHTCKHVRGLQTVGRRQLTEVAFDAKGTE